MPKGGSGKLNLPAYGAVGQLSLRAQTRRNAGENPVGPNLFMKLIVILCLVSFACLAQRATELFIPIGKSPGLSREGKTIIGKVSAADNKTVTVSGRSVHVVDVSEVYLDRSAARKQNTYGKFDDIKTGTSVEIYAPVNSVAVWIKIQTE